MTLTFELRDGAGTLTIRARDIRAVCICEGLSFVDTEHTSYEVGKGEADRVSEKWIVWSEASE